MLDILLAEDEVDIREILLERLSSEGHRVQGAANGRAAADLLDQGAFDVVICDVRLPEIDGLTLLRTIRATHPGTDVIMMTASMDVAQAVGALKEGACDYLTKPFDLDELMLQIQRISETHTLRRQLQGARGALAAGRGFDPTLVGDSPVINRLRERVGLVSKSDVSVLITGATGTGKEVIARLIHAGGARRDEPFVSVNCGALTESLIEAELFGYERGAFTGADRRRDGRFKAADGGTLLLDEVAELPLSAQTRLLRVAQEGTVEPLGANDPLKVDVRILSATHRNLAAMVKAGTFREDLYYRLNVIEVPVPSLGERTGDLALLLRHFMQKFTRAGAALPTISAEAWNAIASYPFPGNVRELAHAVEHAMVLAGGREVELIHLPAALAGSALYLRGAGDGVPIVVRPLRLALRDFEHAYLQRAVEACEGKRSRAAAALGISRKTLWQKLRHAPSDLEPPSVSGAIAGQI